MLSSSCRRIVESRWFQTFITGFILFAGVIVGVETYPGLVERYRGLLHSIDLLILWVFLAEVVLKMTAEGSRPLRYFRDPWNVFDFFVVAASFLAMFAAHSEDLEHGIVVLRLVRLLRVLRLVRAVPKLQILVNALIRSIPSMSYVSVLLFLLFYVYAVAGVFLFGPNDPVHFGNLQTSLLSLFRTVTLEDWTDLMYIQMHGCAGYGYDGNEALCTQSMSYPLLSPVFFVSFVLLGTMIVLNLFIGVIMTGMQEAQAESEQEQRQALVEAGAHVPALSQDLQSIERQLDELQKALGAARRRAEQETVAQSRESAGPVATVETAAAV